MNVNYELYKIFLVVAESSTITEAAKKLFISQPAITKSIKNLEKQLNTILFIRNTKGIKLTKEGRELYKQIKPAIDQLLKAEQDISFRQEEQVKELKIGISDPFFQACTTMPLKQILNKRNFKISIKISKQKKLLSEICNEQIDIGIAQLTDINTYNKELNITQIGTLNFCIIENNTVNTIQSTKKIICNDINFINLFPEYKKTANYIIVDSYTQIYELVIKNLGIGIIPKEFLKCQKNDRINVTKENIIKKGIYLITSFQNTNRNVQKLAKLITENMSKEKQR